MSSSRRNNKEGNFVWMSKRNLWRCMAWVRMDDGTLKRKSVYGSTKTEAKEKMQELQRMSKLGILSQQSKSTLGEYLDGWWNGANLKPASTLARKLNVDRIKPIIGGVQLSDLQSSHIIHLAKRLRTDISKTTGRPLSPAARKQCWANLRKALADAVISGLIEINPFSRVPKDLTPKVEPRAERILSVEERAKLYKHEPDEFTPLWKLLIMLGMRSGEACALRWKDINFESMRLHINHTIRRDKSDAGYKLGTPKTKKSRRTIDLQPLHVEILRSIETYQQLKAHGNHAIWHTTIIPNDVTEPEDERSWSEKNPNGFLFTRELGAPVVPDYAKGKFNKKLADAGIDKARVHDLRHCFAYDQIKMGIDILHISSQMGHSSVSTTLNIYGHISRETKERSGQVSVELYLQSMNLGT